jgi:hypothetical protein
MHQWRFVSKAVRLKESMFGRADTSALMSTRPNCCATKQASGVDSLSLRLHPERSRKSYITPVAFSLNHRQQLIAAPKRFDCSLSQNLFCHTPSLFPRLANAIASFSEFSFFGFQTLMVLNSWDPNHITAGFLVASNVPVEFSQVTVVV